MSNYTCDSSNSLVQEVGTSVSDANECRRYTFGKAEHLCSRKHIDALFRGTNKSVSSYPIRIVYRFAETDTPGRALVMLSVPKRHFKHAVDRNKVKRRLREAYRHVKHTLTPLLNDNPAMAHSELHMAVMWLSAEHLSTQAVEEKMLKLLQRIAERHYE